MKNFGGIYSWHETKQNLKTLQYPIDSNRPR